MNSLTLKLPFPPTVNNYWVHRRRGTFISDKGIAFQKEVWASCRALQAGRRNHTGRLSVEVDIYPPDKRRHDLDNLMKGLLDALQYAGVYKDDSQIDRLLITRRGIATNGVAVVTIQEI